MASTPRGNDVLTPATPSPGHTSRSISQNAVKCRVKPRKDDKSVNAQPQADYTQSSNSLTFKYSARRSADCVSMSATNTSRQTARATQVYTRNTVSHLHYLERKIMLIHLKADSFRPELQSRYSLLLSKIDRYSDNLNRSVAQLRSKSIRGDELKRRLKLLNARKDSYTADLKRRFDLLKATKQSYYIDLVRHSVLLCARVHRFATQLHMQFQLLDSKIQLCFVDIDERTAQLSTRYGSYISAFTKEIRDVDIYKCTCGALVASPSARINAPRDKV